jgi:hypothetical protein
MYFYKILNWEILADSILLESDCDDDECVLYEIIVIIIMGHTVM